MSASRTELETVEERANLLRCFQVVAHDMNDLPSQVSIVANLRRGARKTLLRLAVVEEINLCVMMSSENAHQELQG